MAKLTTLRCPYCGGNIIDDPADERTYCLMCSRGVDYIRALSAYPTFTKEEQGTERHTSADNLKVFGGDPDHTDFYRKHPLR